jgi:hypothetical protein
MNTFTETFFHNSFQLQGLAFLENDGRLLWCRDYINMAASVNMECGDFLEFQVKIVLVILNSIPYYVHFDLMNYMNNVLE